MHPLLELHLLWRVSLIEKGRNTSRASGVGLGHRPVCLGCRYLVVEILPNLFEGSQLLIVQVVCRPYGFAVEVIFENGIDGLGSWQSLLAEVVEE